MSSNQQSNPNHQDPNNALAQLLQQLLQQQQQGQTQGGSQAGQGSRGSQLPPHQTQVTSPPIAQPGVNPLLAAYLQQAPPSPRAAAMQLHQLNSLLAHHSQFGAPSGPNAHSAAQLLLNAVVPNLAAGTARQPLAYPQEGAGALGWSQVPNHSQLLANLLSQQQSTNNSNNFGLNVNSITTGVNNDGTAKSAAPEAAPMSANNRNGPSLASAPPRNPSRGSAVPVTQSQGGNEASSKIDTSNDDDIVANAVAAYNSRPQDWTLEQLETTVKKLKEASQRIPPSIAVLLASARHVDEMKDAKKISNRKSAFASRMRKKAQMEAMERENARLKRESLILSSLPDPVLAITTDGEITFANVRCCQMYQRSSDELISSNIDTFTELESREGFWKMISEVLEAKTRGAIREEETKESPNTEKSGEAKQSSEEDDENADEDAKEDMNITDFSSDVSNQKRTSESESGDTGPQPKKAKISENDSTQGPAITTGEASLLLHYHNAEPSDSNQDLKQPPELAAGASISTNQKQDTSSLSGTKSSTNAMQESSASSSLEAAKTEYSDSGNEQSSKSRDSSDTSLSAIMNRSQMRQDRIQWGVPVEPTCIIALIRGDDSSVWCELTASLRTMSDVDGSQISRTSSSADSSDSDLQNGQLTEILICFRPIIKGPKDNDELSSDDLKTEEATSEEPKKDGSSNDA